MSWSINIPHSAELTITARRVLVRYPDGRVLGIRPRRQAPMVLGPITTAGRLLEVRQ